MKNLFVVCDQYKSRLDALRPLPAETLRSLQEYYKIGLTYSSNALEGNSLTESETKIVIENGLTVSGKPLRDVYEALGHAQAYDYLQQMVQESHLSEAQLLSLHRLFYERIDAAHAGTYRSVPVFLSGSRYPLPQPEEIPRLMQEFIRWFNAAEGTLHPAEFAALAHQKFVFIHPFVDGNGRVARLLMNFVLLRAGYEIALVPPVRRGEYIAALEEAHTDTKPFIAFVTGCVIETQKDLLRLFGQSITLSDGVNADGEGVNADDDGVNADDDGVNSLLHLIIQEPGLNARMLAEKTGRSIPTIERRIRILRTEGRIEFRGAPKNGGYYPLTG